MSVHRELAAALGIAMEGDLTEGLTKLRSSYDKRKRLEASEGADRAELVQRYKHYDAFFADALDIVKGTEYGERRSRLIAELVEARYPTPEPLWPKDDERDLACARCNGHGWVRHGSTNSVFFCDCDRGDSKREAARGMGRRKKRKPRAVDDWLS